MSSVKEFCNYCERCESTNDLQYDNVLEGSMCTMCWNLYFELHDQCAYCEEGVLSEKDKPTWFCGRVNKVTDMSVDFGGYVNEDLLCYDCYKDRK